MSSRVHHLNCATMRPPAGRTPWMPERLVAHCLLVEADDGLVLVDTGLGTQDVADPARLGRPFVTLVGAVLEPQETALRQIRALGYRPDDVRDVVLTHLDADHAGGLGDFPSARVHVFADELAAARAPGWREKQRYVAAQWAHGPTWVEHPAPTAGGEDWFGFGAVRVVSDEVLLVPLPGHTRGHSAVAVRRPGGTWFLHAGDAYFFTGEKDRPPHCPSGLRAFQAAMQMDGPRRRANQERLRELHAAHADDVTVFCAHDPTEFEALRDVTE